MRQTIDPSLEYNRGPVLWGAITMAVLGVFVNFVLFRPGWLMPAALVAGGVAAARSGYYDPGGNNGVIGMVLGMSLITPVLAYTRTVFVFDVTGTGDTIFLTATLSIAWLFLLLVLMMPMAYIGAMIVEFTRKHIGGPVGY